jgi:hypothetical protein
LEKPHPLKQVAMPNTTAAAVELLELICQMVSRTQNKPACVEVFAHRLLLTDARAFESELRLVEKARESLPHDPAAKGGGGDGSFQTNPMCWEITSDGKGIGLDRTSRFALKQATGWRGHA